MNPSIHIYSYIIYMYIYVHIYIYTYMQFCLGVYIRQKLLVPAAHAGCKSQTRAEPKAALARQCPNGSKQCN